MVSISISHWPCVSTKHLPPMECYNASQPYGLKHEYQILDLIKGEPT